MLRIAIGLVFVFSFLGNAFGQVRSGFICPDAEYLRQYSKILSGSTSKPGWNVKKDAENHQKMLKWVDENFYRLSSSYGDGCPFELRAKIFLSWGEIDSALAAIDKMFAAKKTYPLSDYYEMYNLASEVYIKIAEKDLAKGDSESALTRYLKAVGWVSDIAVKAKIAENIGDIKSQQGDFTIAKIWYNFYDAKLYSPQIAAKLAQVEAKIAEKQQVEETATKPDGSIDVNRRYNALWIKLRPFRANGNLDESIKVAKMIYDLNGKNEKQSGETFGLVIELFLQRARRDNSDNDYLTAQNASLSYLRLDPNNKVSHFSLGECYFALKSYQNAYNSYLDYFTKTPELSTFGTDPNLKEFWSTRLSEVVGNIYLIGLETQKSGVTLRRNEKFDAVIAERIQKSDENYREARKTFDSSGKNMRLVAYRVANLSVKYNAANAKALNLRGGIAYILEEFGSAYQDFQAAVKSEPTNATYRKNLEDAKIAFEKSDKSIMLPDVIAKGADDFYNFAFSVDSTIEGLMVRTKKVTELLTEAENALNKEAAYNTISFETSFIIQIAEDNIRSAKSLKHPSMPKGLRSQLDGFISNIQPLLDGAVRLKKVLKK